MNATNFSASLLKGTNLYLVGMMGAGKSTVGQAIAQRLQYRFFDTDDLVERAGGQSISDIFATAGEAAFREAETQVLAQLSAYARLVVATGGGIVLKPKNWSYLHHGIVVWLDVPVEMLYQRLQGDASRPLLQNANPAEKLATLLAERRSHYALADIHLPITTMEAPEETADRILASVLSILKSPQQPPHLETES